LRVAWVGGLGVGVLGVACGGVWRVVSWGWVACVVVVVSCVVVVVSCGGVLCGWLRGGNGLLSG